MSVQPFPTTLFGVPFPLFTPQGRRASQLRTVPEREMLHKAGHGGHFGNPIQDGVPGLQRGPKAKPPRPTFSFFRSDCHIPVMESADRRLRPVKREELTRRVNTLSQRRLHSRKKITERACPTESDANTTIETLEALDRLG